MVPKPPGIRAVFCILFQNTVKSEAVITNFPMNSSPETSTPAENLPLKPGSLNLTENHEHPALDPERILDALKKRAESAVTKEEREKFQKLADKLSATLVSKSEQAVDGTKDAWTKLRSEISPEQKKILQDAETALKTGTAKLEDVARSTIAKSQEIGGQVVEAARTGNVTELKKLAADVEETVNDAGQKVMKYSGAKAFEKMLEPLKTQGIAGIFAVIMNFWKFLTGGMKWSEVVEGAQTQVTGVVAAGTATAQAALGRTETAIESFRNMTPKELEKLTIKMADGIADDLSKTYFGGAKLSEDKIKKIRGIVASSNLRPEELQKIAKQIQEKGKITIENLAQILGTVSTGATELMWKIAFSGIVPLKHIAYEAVASGSKTAVGLTFYGLGLPPMTMTIEGIHALISKYSPIS